MRYQVNEELADLCKGDIVRVKGKDVKQIDSIYTAARQAFKRVKGHPPSAFPKDCPLLQRAHTMIWEQMV